jgi:2-keto-4-pentenoate hydratase
MTNDIAAWGRRIHGPTLPGTGVRCTRDTPLTPDEMDEVVGIVAAARAGRHGATLPDRLKTRHWESTMTAMMRINDRLAWPSAGWKIGAASIEVQRAEGMPGPSPGQLARHGVCPSPAQVPASLFINYRCAESEFAFRMAHDLAPRDTPYSEDEVAEAVGALHPALEIGDIVFDDWYGASGYFGAALDNNGAAAFVPGNAITDWRDLDLATARVDLSLNGVWQKSGVGAAAMGHPLTALTWVTNWLRERHIPLRAGEYVSTGSCTGHFFVQSGDRLVADFGALGVVDATFLDKGTM